jgi:hypothetical protein
LVILDDIASLEWLGFSLLDLSRFSRALKNLCAKVRRMLTLETVTVLQSNIDGCSIGCPASHRYSPRARCALAALAPIMHVSHRGQTSSQRTKRRSEWRGKYVPLLMHQNSPNTKICVHLGPSVKDTKEHIISRTSALQYRLTEASAIFFEKGTSTGVL